MEGESEALDERLRRTRTFFGMMDDLGLGDFVEFDLSVVRGLAYYTGIVFEVFDRGGELRAICGGGRYDRLLEWAGGEPLSAVGFGMGDVVLSDLLLEKQLVPEYQRELDIYIVTVAAAQMPVARQVGRAMRERGRNVVYPLRHQPIKKQFSAAAASGAREVMVLGPEEVARGLAKVRDMATGEERETPLERWAR
jgi:histidyl-tRNA synthetase